MASTPAILAIDQGTTNTKALVVGLDGMILGTSSVPTGVDHPKPGWAQTPAAMIRDSVAAAVMAARAQAGDAAILAIGISNQRESVVAWDAVSGEAVGPCVIWQCLRSAPLCDALRQAGHADEVAARSGLGLDPMFSAGKLRWLLDHGAGPRGTARDLAQAGELRAGTVDAWLLWALTGGAAHACDAGNASRTQLLNLDTIDWDPRLLDLFGIPAGILPLVCASNALFGHTVGGFAGLPEGIPIHAMMGDSHAALFGHAIDGPGRVKVTLGTGSSLMAPTSARTRSTHGLSSTIAWQRDAAPVHALEGNIIVSGHAASFGAQMLGLDGPEALSALAASVPDAGGVQVVPALAGLGAPHWQADARGLICGLSLASRPAHVARAVLEGIAHQICDVLAALGADLGGPFAAISVDGQAAANDLLMQMLADLSGRTVERPAQTALSALGAAMLAADAIDRPLAESLRARDRSFAPCLAEEPRQAARAAWGLAVARATMESPT
ncbi:glycerol kinase [Novosphingobium sp. 1529]|uniref:FGGY family carbohydrate kinase n=1 Tax=Novosphingobium sp. 1529 TaxID=3156424 RepID=UPI003398EE38